MTESFELALLIVGHGDERPIVASVRAESRVQELLDALSAPGSTLFRGDQPLGPTCTLVEAHIESGDTLGLDAPVLVGWRQLGPELRVIGGVGAGLRRRIEGGAVVVGRDQGAGVVLESTLVSRRHAEFRWHGDGFAVRDLDSRHGVVVEGRRIDPGVAVRLAAGTAVAVADAVITVVGGSESGGTPRRADPFHVFLIGGRVGPPTPPNGVTLPSGPPVSHRRSFAPFVVPSAGAVALAAAAGGAPTPVAIAATPAAMIVGLLAERGLSARTARRSEQSHARELADEGEVVRAAAASFAHAQRVIHPDAAALLAAAERRAPLVWSSPAADFAPRVGLAPQRQSVPIEGDAADIARLEDARVAALVPVTVDLRRGPVVLAGPESTLHSLATWMVMQAAALVSPHELEILIVSDDSPRWSWTAWLPHAATVSVVPAATHPVAVGAATRPARLVVLDGATAPEWHDVQHESNDLQLWRVDRHHDTPTRATTVITATGDSSLSVDAAGAIRDDVLADGLHDPPVTTTRLGLLLSALRSPLGGDKATPDSIRVCDVAPHVTSADAIARAWARRESQLELTVGANDSGPLRVALSGQNSHALVAGTTGSGKTRLLESLAVGLAADHSPSALHLLVIDFKGGNELAGLAQLPHCVGIVSDRDAREVDRALAALTREIARRDEMFAAVGATDLNDYARKSAGALPRLVVIADEFGQFRRDDANGGRVATLLRIASQGRSKGLHLILATQSPSSDVTPEIRQNVGVRMCLRVAEASESVAVLGVGDAVALTRPGRVLVSVDNELHTAQAALSRGVAAPAGDEPLVVRGLIDAATREHAAATANDGDIFDAVVAVMNTAAFATNATKPHLLNPALSARVVRTEIRGATRAWSIGGFVIGERDRPGVAEAAPLTFDPPRDGAITFIGGARSGRSQALLALAEAARTQTDAAHPVRVHTIDWADGLGALEGAGGDAGVVHRGDLEHLRRLARWLATDPDDGATRLVLVDRLDLLTRDLRELDGGAFASEFLDVMNTGPRRGVYAAATTDPGGLLTGTAALAGRRVLLSVDDPSIATAAGLPFRSSTVPGRGVSLPDGDEIQIGLVGEPSRGEPPADGVIARMPSRVDRTTLPATTGERIVFGVGGDAILETVEVDLDHVGPVVAVIGRAGSGRSTALDTIAASYAGSRSVVRLDPSSTAEWTLSSDASLVLADDAARCSAAHPWLNSPDLAEDFRRGGHVLVAAFEQSDLTTLGYSHWIMRRPCPGLLLALDATADRVIAGERLGFHPPSDLRAGRSGRGWWCFRGRGVPVQVATN